MFIDTITKNRRNIMEQAKVSASSVNVRSGPSTKKKLLGRMNRGETFSYSSDQNGWLQTVYKSQTAYVCKQYTTTVGAAQTIGTPAPAQETPAETSQTADSDTGAKVRINANKVNIRKGPSKKNGCYGQVNKGSEFTLLGSEGGEWYKIEYKGNVAYVMQQFADKVSAVQEPTPAPTTVPEPSAATPDTPTASPETTWTGEKLLTSKQEKAAISYSESENLASIWKDIQSLVGVAQTGTIDEASVQAIASWQKKNGLTPDGKFGNKSFNKSGLSKPAESVDTNSAEAQEQALTGKLKYVNNTYVRKYSGGSGRHVKQLVDLNTGKRFNISWARPSGTYHSDVTPNDKASTDVVKNIVNPSKDPSDNAYWGKGRAWDWTGHPGAMQLSNGVWIACGFHLRPHGAPQGGNPDYPWNQSSPASRPANYSSRTPEGKDAWKPGGHFCLYYNESNDGGTKGCREAVLKAKNMKVPE